MTTDELANATAFATSDEHSGDLRVVLNQAKHACRTLAAENERLRLSHVHCDDCGGSWLDDGVNPGCRCHENERLREALAFIFTEVGEDCECDFQSIAELGPCLWCMIRAAAEAAGGEK